MQKYIQLDETNKIISVREYQNTEGTLILKEITEEQLADIFYYTIVDGELILGPQKAIDTLKKQLADLDKYMPRPVEDSYVILTSTGNIAIVDLGSITVAENTTLLDIYNQKVTLRSQLAS
jgi:hypothetical protein